MSNELKIINGGLNEFSFEITSGFQALQKFFQEFSPNGEKHNYPEYTSRRIDVFDENTQNFLDETIQSINPFLLTLDPPLEPGSLSSKRALLETLKIDNYFALEQDYLLLSSGQISLYIVDRQSDNSLRAINYLFNQESYHTPPHLTKKIYWKNDGEIDLKNLGSVDVIMTDKQEDDWTKTLAILLGLNF